MQKRNLQLLPIVASIGIGAITYSMMTGKGGQLQNILPSISKITGNGQSSMGSNQQGQQGQQGQQDQMMQQGQQILQGQASEQGQNNQQSYS
ncbi:hypothetical protein [Alkalibacillus silvisoli]|uniref:Uncharacterized protein n=1 Tax=Alkalibacillus silvisoli TaxID=392823 RepID=A0ABP3K3H3_9BACI